MENWETMQIKREIFTLYDSVIPLWNNFYRKNGNFNETDIKAIKNILKLIEKNIKEINEEIKYYE